MYAIMCKIYKEGKHSKEWYENRGLKPLETRLNDAQVVAIRKDYKACEDWLRWDLRNHIDSLSSIFGGNYERGVDSNENHVNMIRDITINDEAISDYQIRRYYYIQYVKDS